MHSVHCTQINYLHVETPLIVRLLMKQCVLLKDVNVFINLKDQLVIKENFRRFSAYWFIEVSNFERPDELELFSVRQTL